MQHPPQQRLWLLLSLLIFSALFWSQLAQAEGCESLVKLRPQTVGLQKTAERLPLHHRVNKVKDLAKKAEETAAAFLQHGQETCKRLPQTKLPSSGPLPWWVKSSAWLPYRPVKVLAGPSKPNPAQVKNEGQCAQLEKAEAELLEGIGHLLMQKDTIVTTLFLRTYHPGFGSEKSRESRPARLAAQGLATHLKELRTKGTGFPGPAHAYVKRELLEKEAMHFWSPLPAHAPFFATETVIALKEEEKKICTAVEKLRAQYADLTSSASRLCFDDGDTGAREIGHLGFSCEKSFVEHQEHLLKDHHRHQNGDYP